MRPLTQKHVLPLVLFCIAAPLLAAAQTTVPVKKQNGTVTGRVTVNGKGRAGIVVGVHIRAFDPTHSPARTARTDADGVYRIKNVPPGTYSVAPLSTSFVFADEALKNSQGKTLIMSEGETVEGIDFAMIRGAVITGKVTEDDGTPAIETEVLALFLDSSGRTMSFDNAVGFATDDRGIYRIFGLRPGKYKVAVGESELERGAVIGRGKYQRVYYPNVPEANVDKATVIELGEGDQASNIDIVIASPPVSFAASGIVVNGESTSPVSNARVMVRRITNEGISDMWIGTTSNQRGEFKLENLTPGKYELAMSPPGELNLRAEPLKFDVVDEDVTRLTLRTTRGGTISGTVVIGDSNDPALFAKVRSMRVYASVRNETVGFSQPATIGADGTFQINSLPPGEVHLQLVSTSYLDRSRFAIARIEREGVVVNHDAVLLKAGEDVTGLRLVLSYKNGTVQGTVTFENASIPPHVFVQLVKSDTPGVVAGGEVDARGHFLIEAVAPGNYDVKVAGFNPGSRVRSDALATKSITVTQDAVTEVNFSIDVPPN